MTTTFALNARSNRPTKVKSANAHQLKAIADIAVHCLLLELETWPKPGLVSHVDTGSHTDMNADTFRRSVKAIQPYLQAMADAASRGCEMGRLRTIGLEGESAMFAATDGVNTHRGALFGLGLLCAALGAKAAGRVDPAMPLGDIVTRFWRRDILDGPVLLHSHGSEVRRRYGTGGARLEAARGFPSIYEIGLPALEEGTRIAAGDAEAARVHACFALVAALKDTNLLHRGGLSGLCFAQRAARRFLERGGVGRLDWRRRALVIHRSFVVRRLTPGGSADLLAMSLFTRACEEFL
jgi:triphosphoribosyl-dephospho-CoA synthase